MAYPETCFTDLIAVRGICEPKTATYYLNDIPGIDLSKLAEVAETDTPTGKKLAEQLIESAARFMAADVEAIYDGQYKVENTLVSGCSTCTFTNNYAAGTQLGVLIKNNTESGFSRILVDKLTAKLNQTGTFNVVIDDGDAANQRVIEYPFEAGVEYDFQGLNYITRRKSVRIYVQEAGVPLAQLSCKRGGSGCGCSGAATVVSDLVYTGTLNGAEQQQAYGFQPCAMIICDAADLLCFVAHSAPRMIGMALLYKTAELYFETTLLANRNNKTVGTKTELVEEEAKRYNKLYRDKLDGTKTRGVKDLVFTTLQQTNDVCVICNSLLGTAWATG
jgi:hypothetical protein